MGWVIHEGLLVSVGGGQPPPTGSVPIDVPEGFLTQPERYTLYGDRLVELSEVDPEPVRRAAMPRLTMDEVALIKAAIAEGRL